MFFLFQTQLKKRYIILRIINQWIMKKDDSPFKSIMFRFTKGSEIHSDRSDTNSTNMDSSPPLFRTVLAPRAIVRWFVLLPEVLYPVLLLELFHNFINHFSFRLLISLSIHKNWYVGPTLWSFIPGGFQTSTSFQLRLQMTIWNLSSIPAFCGEIWGQVLRVWQDKFDNWSWVWNNQSYLLPSLGTDIST